MNQKIEEARELRERTRMTEKKRTVHAQEDPIVYSIRLILFALIRAIRGQLLEIG